MSETASKLYKCSIRIEDLAHDQTIYEGVARLNRLKNSWSVVFFDHKERERWTIEPDRLSIDNGSDHGLRMRFERGKDKALSGMAFPPNPVGIIEVPLQVNRLILSKDHALVRYSVEPHHEIFELGLQILNESPVEPKKKN